MHFRCVKAGFLIVIRTPEGEKEGKALYKEGESWVLEGDYRATIANLVKIIRPKKEKLDDPG